MLHSIRAFVVDHRYLSAFALSLLLAWLFVRGGQAELEASATGWHRAHEARMAVVDR